MSIGPVMLLVLLQAQPPADKSLMPPAENPRAIAPYLPDRSAGECTRRAQAKGGSREALGMILERYLEGRKQAEAIVDRKAADEAANLALQRYASDLIVVSPSLAPDAESLGRSLLRRVFLEGYPRAHHLIDTGHRILVDEAWAEFVTNSEVHTSEPTAGAIGESLTSWKLQVDEEIAVWMREHSRVLAAVDRAGAEYDALALSTAMGRIERENARLGAISLRAIESIGANLEPTTRWRWETCALRIAYRDVIPTEAPIEGLVEVVRESLPQGDMKTTLSLLLDEYGRARLQCYKRIARASIEQATRSDPPWETPSLDLVRAFEGWIDNESLWVLRFARAMPADSSEVFRQRAQQALAEVRATGGSTTFAIVNVQQERKRAAAVHANAQEGVTSEPKAGP